MDCCPTHRLRVNGNRSLHKSDPFLHAGETQPFTLPCCIDVEAFTLVSDCEMNFLGVLRELNFEPFDATVLDGIVQGLLQDSEECHTDFERYSTGYISFKVHFYALTFAEFPAPASYACNNTQVF